MKEIEKHTNFTPEGYHTITPRIVVRDTHGLVEFLRNIFGATGEFHENRPSEMRIGDSLIMISDVGVRKTTNAFLYVYVQDVDTTYQKALDAGVSSIEKPTNQPYGDRRCMVQDNWGNTWQIAQKMKN